MPYVERPDGIEIHWVERGEGRLVVLVPHCLLHPDVFEPLAHELEGDHRVVRYDARGTGKSTPSGPHDMDTGAEDLAAVIEAAGGSAVAVCLADAASRAVRVGAGRPELIEGIVVTGGLPAGRHALEGSEAMATYDAVVEAMLSMLETDHRGALRSLVTAGNPQMSEDEIRERVRALGDYIPRDTVLARIRAWSEDDATEFGLRCGGKLWLLYADETSGGWFPSGRQAIALAKRLFPNAHVDEIEDGLVSRPDLTAAIVRWITARTRTPAA